MRRIESITDVRFFDHNHAQLLHVPDPHFEGRHLKLPSGTNVKDAEYMMFTYDDGDEERVDFD